jgi:hypothetical protein
MANRFTAVKTLHNTGQLNSLAYIHVSIWVVGMNYFYLLGPTIK